jgi:Fe2+ transport system protein FeoA
VKLSELEKGQRAIIKDIDLPDKLKQRLHSMGLNKNEIIFVCRVGFLKGSFYIKIECESCIIISKNEADHIEVELMEEKSYQDIHNKKLIQSCETCCQDEDKTI